VKQMQFGVVVTTEELGGYAAKLLSAAIARGWECRCFLTDTGVRLLANDTFRQLVQSGRLRASVCEVSWERLGGGPAPEWAPMGSQYQNAELTHNCDKVIVF
jgi:hypothetical protein